MVRLVVMNVSDWPFCDGGFIFMSRPEDEMAGWYFVDSSSGRRTFCHPEHGVDLEILLLELSFRLSDEVWDAVKVMGDEEAS